MLDVLIKNGRIIDGTANPRFAADVGIQGSRIVEVRKCSDSEAVSIVDATDQIVCPGFINMHAHSDLRVFKHPEEDSTVMQGFTTVVLGQDGLSVAPLDSQNKALMMSRVSGLLGTYLTQWPWHSMSEYLDALGSIQPGINIVMLVPHGAVRVLGMGWDNRPASDSELATMKQILAHALEEGAYGLSTGLIYPPGMYADKRELVELCKVTAKYGGVFVVHMRNEGDGVCESVREVTEVCIDAGCPLHISHLKVAGRRNWGRSGEVLDLLTQASAKGLEITFDQYPYIAGSTMLDAVIPPRFHSGGAARLFERLRDPKIRRQIYEMQEKIDPEPWDNWVDYAGWDGIVINSVRSESNRFVEGKTIAAIASELGKEPVDVVCDLLIQEDGAVTMTEFYGTEGDVTNFMRSEFMTLCSDGIASGKAHPRVYGSCARFLGKYVREEGVVTLPQAIKRMTSLPAQILCLQDRGLVREGLTADIVIFDPERIIDRGTFADPAQYPSGIGHVLVGGQFAVMEGQLTGVRNGRVLVRK